MKSVAHEVLNTLKKPVAQYLKKEVGEVIKEGIKATNVLEQAVKHLKIEDKVNINSNKFEKFEQQDFSYKPQVKSIIKESINNLFNTPKHNFSNIINKQSYFYSNVTGMDKEIDVTSDYIFKGIFSDEARTKDFLENILIGNNKILPNGSKIQELEYIKNEYIQNKMPEEAKKTIFDLQIKTNNGIFIIEMQKSASNEYLKRVEFYNAIAYSNQLIKECKSSMKDYTKALPIVTISVIKGRLFEDEVPCVSYHVNKEGKTGKQFMDAISYVFIELDKFDENNYNESMITDNEKDWLTFMKTQDLTQTYNNDQVKSAVKYVDNIKNHKYEDYLRHQMSELATQKEIENAEQKGINKGETIGIEKGENKAKIEIARKMLAKNKDLEEIIELTGLTKEDVFSLRNEN